MSKPPRAKTIEDRLPEFAASLHLFAQMGAAASGAFAGLASVFRDAGKAAREMSEAAKAGTQGSNFYQTGLERDAPPDPKSLA